ncbi:MAG: hypothetical protein EXX96DRAFT_575315 [Benjaminiella poitrasii]|nr:MAG: hypothetical protein EXX96DRAFT_575315 [Benjaminiella poitrasii]
MSLVPNYGSSSESEDSDTESKPQQVKRSLSSLLPQPKKTVYIDLPKINDDEPDEVERNPKRNKSSTGLGLADLLPAPKNTPKSVPVSKTTTDKAFIPHSLAKKLKGKGKAISEEQSTKEEEKSVEQEKQYKTEEVKDEEVIEEKSTEKIETPKQYTGPFFRLGKDLKEEPVKKAAVQKPAHIPIGSVYTVEKPPEEPQMTAVDAYAYDPNAMYSADPSVYYQYQQQAYEESSSADNIDLEKFVGRRARVEAGIQIKTINQQDILPSEEWKAAQALTAAPKFNTGASMQASKLQMKKNNIMALAAHAINNQDKLDEMFAANKKTRREAAKKYGF